MKYYGKAWGVAILLWIAIGVGFLYFWQHANLRKEELEEKRDRLFGWQQQLQGGIVRKDQLEQQTAPYREFTQHWPQPYQELDIGNLFLALDEMASQHGLATSRKSTSRRPEWGHGQSSRQVTVLSITVTGSYRQMLLFLNRLPVRFPLLKADQLSVRPSGKHSVESTLQMSIPWR